MTDPREVTVAVQNIIKEAPFTLVELAEKSGISYDSLRSWNVGRRAPRRSSCTQLASGLRKKAAELQALADNLERSSTP